MSDASPDESTQSSLASITRGASLFFVGNVLSKGFKFVLNLLLTRGLGASLYGIYAYTTTILWPAAVLAQLGTVPSLLKFVPAYEDDPERRNRYVGLAYLTVTLASAAVGAGLYLLAPLISSVTLNAPLLVDVLRILTLVLPFRALIRLTNGAFRGIERLEYQVLIANVVRPLTQIAVVAIALLLGYSLLGVVSALAVGTVLVALTAVTLLYERTSLRPTITVGQPRAEIAEFYDYSLPLTLKNVGMVLYRRIDILMVGFFLAESAVGIYRVAILVSTIIALPLTAFNQLFPSVVSRLYENDRTDEIEAVYEIVTRWTITVASVPAFVTALYSTELLVVFGGDFADGALVLTLFTVAQLINCAVGPCGNLLMMTGHQYLNMLNQSMLGILNVIFNYVFILEFGLIGAALATAGVLTIINCLRLVEVWYTERMIPYSIRFWKPIAASAMAGPTMWLLSIPLEGYVLLVSGSVAGGLVFAGSLLAFGIEEQDRSFFAETLGEKLS
jgi:O-antigen/teichoic acid export membrane protein